MPDFSTAPVRLTVAAVCTALALLLILIVLVRRLFRRVRRERRYGSYHAGYTPRYQGRSGRGRGGAPVGLGPVSHHSRPSSSRRYGGGVRPASPRRRHRRVSRRKYGSFARHSDPAPGTHTRRKGR